MHRLDAHHRRLIAPYGAPTDGNDNGEKGYQIAPEVVII